MRVNTPLVAAVAATAVCALVYHGHARRVIELPWLDSAELGTRDARFRLRGPRAVVGDDIVLVVLDDATRARMPELWVRRAGQAIMMA